MMAEFLPYSTQWIDEDDIASVEEALRSSRITQGPLVETFEERFGITGAVTHVGYSNSVFFGVDIAGFEGIACLYGDDEFTGVVGCPGYDTGCFAELPS